MSQSSNSLGPLTVTPLRDAAALAALAGEWNLLAGEIPFRRYEWMRSWWDHYAGPQQELFTLAVHDASGQLVAIAPWFRSESAAEGRVLRFLGSGEVCSDYLTLLTRDGAEAAASRTLADWLATAGSDEWDLLELTGVEAGDAPLGQLSAGLTAHGHRAHQRADLSCWPLDLPGDWDQYLGTLSKSRRERTRSLLRRNFATGKAVLRTVTNEQELEQALAILIDLHQKRRRSLGQQGCFASLAFESFHRRVAGQLLAAGRLRLLWTEFEGRPIAVEYGFVGGDTIYYYQGGFDPEAADQRPGWLSFAASLKLAIEQGYRHYDFLRGDESYKASWGAQPRPLIELRIVGRRPAARVRHAAWRTGQTVKRWARKGLALRGAQQSRRQVGFLDARGGSSQGTCWI